MVTETDIKQTQWFICDTLVMQHGDATELGDE